MLKKSMPLVLRFKIFIIISLKSKGKQKSHFLKFFRKKKFIVVNKYSFINNLHNNSNSDNINFINICQNNEINYIRKYI